ncbi:hypothetical protein ACFX13_015851 [Malus domestica]
MARQELEELVVHLEHSMDLSSMKHGIKLVAQVPWAVMKQNFSVKKQPPELALEEVKMAIVPFWVQIRGSL